ncbi:MAG: hypothetical protein HQK81_10320 [Desulfovibrionaceae bacterium]|nr:hypothetical protein [Desulfovibrionaceae bacterium]MBF0514436.1 hypothetical protein [Desulfovibrionaceae bacterium]
MILIGTPSYNGCVTINYLDSLLGTLDVCRREGVGTGMQFLAYQSLIPYARNCIAGAFLRRREFSHLLFIDADLGFPPEAAVRYLRFDKDVVCGVYPVKHLDVDRLRSLPRELSGGDAVSASLQYTVKLKGGCEVDQGFVPVRYAPAGFMLIKRRVLTRMAEAYPELRYGKSHVNADGEEGDNWAFFDTLIDRENNEYLPEDYAFCKRWTDLGGEIHADVLSRFTHSGNCDFAGDYPAYLKNNCRAGGEG